MVSSWKGAMQSRHFCRVPGRAGPWEMGRISPDGEGAKYESLMPQGHWKSKSLSLDGKASIVMLLEYSAT